MTVAELIDQLKTYDPTIPVSMCIQIEGFELKGDEVTATLVNGPVVPLQSLQLASLVSA